MTTLYQARDSSAEFRAEQRKKVRVGSVAIAHAAIAREMQNHEALSPLQAWQEATRALVVREMLLQEARRLGLSAVPLSDADGRRETDEEALIRNVIETQVAAPEADEPTCRRYYERNKERFRSADLYEAAHILLAASPQDAETRAAKRALARRLLEALAESPGSFASLAAEHSACPSAGVGGNLGQIQPGDTVPEFDRALASLPVGAISPEPVETRFGWHIVRLDRRSEGQLLPFEIVYARIAAYLHERSLRRATAQYLALLASRAGIEGAQLPTPADVGAF